jgi:aromatic ring-opening dioxygenase LigB subunit
MVLVHACVMPHGAMVLDKDMQDLPDGASELYDANVATADALAASEPELIVLTTPHGMALDSAVGIYKHATIEGTAAWAGAWEDYTVSGEGDADAADSLVEYVRAQDFDAAPVSGPGMYAPLRWGEAVPLWFLQQAGALAAGGSKVLIISWPTCRLQARDFTPVAQTFGTLLAEWASALPKRVAILASCDMSHAHPTPDGALSIYTSPMYPADQATPELAASFDTAVVNWATKLGDGQVAEAGKELLSNFPIVDEAKACGWSGFLTVQAAMAAEAAVGGGRSWGGLMQGYSHPTYFGMMCASFSRNPSVAKAVGAAGNSNRRPTAAAAAAEAAAAAAGGSAGDVPSVARL